MSSQERDKRPSASLPQAAYSQGARLLEELRENLDGCAADDDAPPPTQEWQPEQFEGRRRASAEQP